MTRDNKSADQRDPGEKLLVTAKPPAGQGSSVIGGQTVDWTRQRRTCPGSEADRKRQRGWGQRLRVTPSSFPSLHT